MKFPSVVTVNLEPALEILLNSSQPSHTHTQTHAHAVNSGLSVKVGVADESMPGGFSDRVPNSSAL